MTPLERFEAKIQRTDGCWLWTGSRISSGYGNFTIQSGRGRRWVLAHRMAIEFATGQPVPADLVVDHLCRTRLCVRPDHLEVVTSAENTLRMMTWRNPPKPTLACRRGHPWELGDFSLRKDGTKTCLICRRVNEAERLTPDRRADRAARRRAARAAGLNW